MELRYRITKNKKLRPGLAHKQYFAEERKLKPKVKKLKCLNWETC